MKKNLIIYILFFIGGALFMNFLSIYNSNTSFNNIIKENLEKNYDNTYGWLKEYNINDSLNNVYLKLNIDGNVLYCSHYFNCTKVFDNVKDIILIFDNIVYILDYDGYIYIFDLDTYKLDNKLDIKRVDNIKNIEKIINYNYCPIKDAGCCISIIAITKNNKYLTIDTFQV